MTTWWPVLNIGALVLTAIAFVWLAASLSRRTGTRTDPKDKGAKHNLSDSLEKAAKEDVDHVFNDEFRQELRNRGRLYFEKIIGDNAMFLQQDLRLTTSQLNEYMKGEITRKLKEEFDKYEQSIMDAKEVALASLQKTNDAIDEQRQTLGKEVQEELLAEKKQLIEHFEANMAEIVNHYVLAAIGNQIDLSDQLEYILAELEANKKAIIEDIQSGT